MSLVNQMLRDLQERKAAQSKPLTGLRAVPASPAVVDRASAKPGWIIAVAGIVSAIAISVWFRTLVDDGDRPIPAGMAGAKIATRPVIPQPVVPTTVKLDAAGQPAGFSGFETNRLDYKLRFLSRAQQQSPEPVKSKSAAVNPRAQPAVGKQVLALADDTSAPMIRTRVSPTARLRREGLTALRAGRPIAAEQLFRQLVESDSDNPESHLLLHAALKAQSRAGAARTALLAGLERTAAPAQLARVLAIELMADGRVNHALAVLNTNRPADKADLDYEAILAAANQRAGNHNAAADIYRVLVSRQPGNGTWWVGLAISQEAAGLARDAARSFATATAAGMLDSTLARYATERLGSLETGS